jgi:hypothetical protein
MHTTRLKLAVEGRRPRGQDQLIVRVGQMRHVHASWVKDSHREGFFADL